MGMQTRSQYRQACNQRPSYPQVVSDNSPTSAPSSVFSSSHSVSTSRASPSAPSSIDMPQQTFASAPLPSPNHSQRENYFGSLSAQGPTSHPEQQLGQQHRAPASQQHVGQRGNGAGAPETAPFLQDFNLVAEAAKRAQMACLMRDFGEVEL